jgi:predicted nuclease of predicted toxin-antitoxin system
MRLLLDAHLSGASIGNPLRADGHDVRAADADPDFRKAPDAFLLHVATTEQRILVSADTGDFRRLLVRIADAGESHFGVMLVPSSMPTNAYGMILRSIRHELDRTQQADWIDRCIWLQIPPE